MRDEISEELMLSYAISMAVEGHQGQFDKAGMPYVLHPARIALKLMEDGYGPKYQTVAWLHDYDEDVTKKHYPQVFIRHHISDDVIEAIELVSNLDDDPYPEFIGRIIDSKNKMAIVIKIYDIRDNTSPRRMVALEKKDPAKAKRLKVKYAGAPPLLEGALNSL